MKALLVGDSLAVGLFAPLRRLVSRDGGELLVDARGGTTAGQWALAPWLASALAARPDLVLVSLGTNDMVTDRDVTADARSLRARVRGAGARLVWIEPPTMPRFRRLAVRVRRTLRAAVPPSELFVSSRLPIEISFDGVHPTARGYDALARGAWDFATSPWRSPLLPALALAAGAYALTRA